MPNSLSSPTMRKYPIGIQDFREIRENNFMYVDKTHILHSLVSRGKFYFLSRPRRFGKSLLLSTLKELFSGNKELFKGLWIENNWDWETKFPVIHIKISQINFQQIGLYDALSKEMVDIAKDLNITLNEIELKDRFKELIRKTAGNKKVVILVDEYDKPIVDNLDNLELADKNKLIFKSFYSVLKDADPYIHFLLLTGVSKFTKVSVFSDLNNLNDITLHPRYATLTGITQQELETNFTEEIITVQAENPNLLSTLREWYNGYTWDGKTSVYNPFSLLSFFESGVFQNFWFNTGTPTFLIEAIKKQGQFNLDESEPVSLLALDYFDIHNIEFISLLFQTGYVTFSELHMQEGWCLLRYPNREVKASMELYLAAAYRYVPLGNVVAPVLAMRTAFTQNNMAEVINIINGSLSSIPYDLWKGATELHYHALVHLTFSLLGTYINSEVHTSKGRCDAIVKTATHVYALEFKLNQTADVALQQILEKGYLSAYTHSGLKQVAIGINLSSEGKNISDWLKKEM